MNRLLTWGVAGALAWSGLNFTCLVGCTDSTKVIRETRTETPGGTTTVTTEKKIETTGDNPPAPRP